MELINAVKYVLQKNEIAMPAARILYEIKKEKLLKINGEITAASLEQKLDIYCDGVQTKKESKERLFYKISGNLYGMLDWLDDAGVEKEINTEDITQPYDVTKIDIISEQFTVEYINKKIDYKELILHPDFQRNTVWNFRQKSRLIESILLKIPIPVFYIDARNEEKWIVIDGLQRLSSIYDYVNGKYDLQELEFLRVLEKKKYSELERKFQRRIEECQLLFYKVRPATPEEIAFNIFTRINTLGSPLSSQEIRHALYLGKSTLLLQQLAESKEFIEAVGEGTAGSLNIRMKDRELILRMLAFKINGIQGYRTNFDDFLNRTMKQINCLDNNDIDTIKNEFKESMTRAKTVFGTDAFRKKYRNTTRRSPVSKTLFETFGNVLLEYSKDNLETHRDKIVNLFQEKLEEDTEYFYSITINTNNKREIEKRFTKAKEIIEQALESKK
ncbi:MAG: DUF262 domain-containing protein [Spirochaetales bacterium]|nr:DUF262 domain-containing protein [Spirochaetales bacterium]